MEKLLAALIPVLCVAAFGPLFSSNMGTVADRKSACERLDGGSSSTKGSLCEVTR